MAPSGGIRRVGRYLLYGELASGGMATVHLGRLVGPVGFSRTIAIKRLHPHLAKDPEFVAMFIDEARLAARVTHPNVVPVLDVVSLENELFLVMDYVHGETLARLVRAARNRNARIPPAVAASIAAGVLHGLHSAHEARSERGEPLEIVHRDVSPQNVIVGIDGVARVLDFGVAKAAERLLQTTREGQIKGKVAYMAPEQLRAGTVNRQTDVYAAAVVLWEALTGERLFAGSSGGEVLNQVLLGEVEAPSRRAAGLPATYDAIVLCGLARERSERFSTAREMAIALESVGVASTTEVGEWVQAEADEALATRARWIASVERGEGAGADVVATDAATVSGLEVDPAAPVPPAAAEASEPRRVGSWPSYALVAAAVLAAVGVTLTVRGLSGRSRAEAPSPHPSAPADESTASAKSDEPAVAPDKQPATAPADPAPPANSSAGTQPTSTPRAHPVTPARADCNPPYTLSPTGKKTYKRNCL